MKTNKEPFNPLEMPNTFEGLLPWIINTFNPNFVRVKDDEDDEIYEIWRKVAKGFDDRMKGLFDERNELLGVLNEVMLLSRRNTINAINLRTSLGGEMTTKIREVVLRGANLEGVIFPEGYGKLPNKEGKN